MIVAPHPPDESARLSSLAELDVLDTVLEDSYDQITRLAAQICEVPISLVSLVDRDRQWFKSRHGLDASETPRDIAYCAHTILGWEMMEVEDAALDERFADNPLNLGAPHVKFYAGVPLRGPDRQALGTLCVIGPEARRLRPEQREALYALAAQVVAQLELRRTVARLDAARRTAEVQAARHEGALRSLLQQLEPLPAQAGFAAPALRAAVADVRAALGAAQAPTPAQTESPGPAAGAPDVGVARPTAKVLVADDNILMRELMLALLTALGADVRLVGDGRAAVEAVAAAQAAGVPYDLVLLDVHMPILDGPAAATAIRVVTDRPLPVAALSADPTAAEDARCAAAGFRALLGKPPSRAALAALLGALKAA